MTQKVKAAVCSSILNLSLHHELNRKKIIVVGRRNLYTSLLKSCLATHQCPGGLGESAINGEILGLILNTRTCRESPI